VITYFSKLKEVFVETLIFFKKRKRKKKKKRTQTKRKGVGNFIMDAALEKEKKASMNHFSPSNPLYR
jgi:hypothetical protein